MTFNRLLSHLLLRIGTACRIRGLLLQEREYLRSRSIEPAGIGWADILRRPERVEIPIRVARFIPPTASIHSIDVGANDGQWASRFLKSFPNSTAELWEPLPQLVETLELRFPDTSRVTIIPAAASSTNGQAKIVEPQHDAMASLHDCADGVAQSSKHGATRSLDIRLERIADQERRLEGASSSSRSTRKAMNWKCCKDLARPFLMFPWRSSKPASVRCPRGDHRRLHRSVARWNHTACIRSGFHQPAHCSATTPSSRTSCSCG